MKFAYVDFELKTLLRTTTRESSIGAMQVFNLLS